MTFFKWDSEDGSIVSSYIWIYFLITALFTAVTLVLWWYFLVYRATKASVEEDDSEPGWVERRKERVLGSLKGLIGGRFVKDKEAERRSATQFEVEP